MKKFLLPLLAAASCVGLSTSALAASAAWNVDAAGLWGNNTLWNPAAAPGANSTLNNPDTATFNATLTAARIVSLDNNRNVQNLVFSSTSGNYVLSSGSLFLSNGGGISRTSGTATDTISSAITIQGDAGTATFTNDASSAISIANVSGNSTLGNTTVLTLNGTGTSTSNYISGLIADGGSGKLAIVKDGAGTWTLVGASNTFSGGVTLNAGNLRLSQNAAAGTGLLTINAGTLTNSKGGNLVLTTSGTVINGNFTMAPTSNHMSFGTGSVSLGNGTGSVRAITASGGGNLTMAGVVSDGSTGTGLNVNIGSAGLVLTGNNTFTGGVTLAGGNLYIGHTNALGTGALTTTAGAISTTSDMTIANNVFSSNNGMTGTGNLTITGNYTNSGANSKFQRTGYTTLAGNVYISENATSRTLQLSNNGTISGVISNGLSAPSSTITLSGASSTWVFSGNNTYTGQTNIQQGILSVSSIGNQTATGSNLSGGTVNFGVTSSTGQLTYTGTGETSNRTMAMIANTTGGAIIDQSGTGLLKLTANLSASGGGNSTRTLTLKGSTAGTGEFAGIIANQNSGNLTAVTKSGTGTWALSGNNSYTGATTVTAGTLLINGSTNAGSLVTVQTGGTLGGNGTIGGAVTVQNGGTLSPGNSPGLLTVASLTLDSGSTSFFQINGTTRVTLYDAVNVTGALSYNGTLSITFGGGYTPLVTDTFTLFNKGSYSGAFSTVTITNPSYAGTFNESTGILSLTAVPEPATWGLLAFSLTTVMVLRRRRRS